MIKEDYLSWKKASNSQLCWEPVYTQPGREQPTSHIASANASNRIKPARKGYVACHDFNRYRLSYMVHNVKIGQKIGLSQVFVDVGQITAALVVHVCRHCQCLNSLNNTIILALILT